MFELDNVTTLADVSLTTQRVGVFGAGGESTAHRRLKLYVAAHGMDFGMSNHATAMVEHRFQTGDRVDLMFHNHSPERTVIEIEVAGEQNICTGIHQAVKYRSLAEVEGGYARTSPKVRSLVVAYETAYPSASTLAERYTPSAPVDGSGSGPGRWWTRFPPPTRTSTTSWSTRPPAHAASGPQRQGHQWQ